MVLYQQFFRVYFHISQKSISPIVLFFSSVCYDLKKKKKKPGVMAHACNPSTWEAEAGGFLSLRPAWSTK
jgi:hypothetical protein